MNWFNLLVMLGFYINGTGVWGYNSRSSEYFCFYCLFMFYLTTMSVALLM